ncbi:putative phosphoglycerate mutase [Terracoccus luteus]|uniref:Putative phosphoglycerate mutase n=1 Tax=Terracoccus luteus TaxID=53356 RepID=A0A495XT67_9MICO|nr:reverse transcriptase-like protein [Terracoccus luteus]RKT77721.1 putative phosphoglycerate mutase [Terracoccus luteus]
MEADGGSRGNPGVAGYGALVRDPRTRAVLVELAEPLGKQSNNVAEYSGLIAGLKAARDIDSGADVLARMDSKLVVEQMSGRWKIKHEDMRRLALEARDVCAEISAAGGSVSFEWIPRERNKDADALSNEGMDGHSVHRVLDGAGDDDSGDDGADGGATAGGDYGPLGDDRDELRDEDTGADAGQGLRLLLVQVPADEAAAARTARAVRHLVGDAPVVLPGAGGPRTGRTAGAAADAAVAALARSVSDAGSTTREDPRWSAPVDDADAAQGGHTSEQASDRASDRDALAAYRDLVRTGGTAVVVTTRRGVLTVVAEVLGLPTDRFWALATAPGSLSGVEVWPDGTASVAFTNRTDHLG